VPSSWESSSDGMKFTLSSGFIKDLKVGGVCYINNEQYCEILSIDTNSNTITTDYSANVASIDSLVYFGVPGESVIIGINADDSKSSTGLLAPRAISIKAFQSYENGVTSFRDKVILGDLSSAPNSTGYGLYSENVKLTGRLTTVLDEGRSYAGINTEDGATATVFDDDNTSIVFWAGSDSESSEDIQKAAFQVTEGGSLYAQKGLFTGSIISKSIIEGSVIRTPKIVGTDTDAALKIYNTGTNENGGAGISFISTDNDTESTTLSIKDTGFFTANETSAFITFNSSNKAVFNGAQFNSPITGTSYVSRMANGKFGIYSTVAGTDDVELGQEGNYIQLSEKEITLKNSSGSIFTIGESDIISEANETIFRKAVRYGDEGTGLVYKQTSMGYDLYVS
jgi:hypothetical protein